MIYRLNAITLKIPIPFFTALKNPKIHSKVQKPQTAKVILNRKIKAEPDMPVFPVFRKQKQEDCHKFKASLNYIANTRPARVIEKRLSQNKMINWRGGSKKGRVPVDTVLSFQAQRPE